MGKWSDRFKKDEKPKKEDEVAPGSGSLADKFSKEKEQKMTVKSFASEVPKADGGFGDKVKRSPELLYLVQGMNQGKKAWYYFLVEKMKHERFKIDVKSDFIDLADYGTILYSGFGEEPPEDVVRKIKDEFGEDAV